MAKAPIRRPFIHAFAFVVAVIAALISLIVFVLGGGMMTVAALFDPWFGDTAKIGVAIYGVTLVAVGISNICCLWFVFYEKDWADPRVFRVVNITNGYVIFTAIIALMFLGIYGVLAYIFAPSITTLLAVHLGRVRSIPGGHCQMCGYNLAGLERGVCPECGNE